MTSGALILSAKDVGNLYSLVDTYPEVIVAREVDLRAGRNSSTLVCPGAGQRRGTVNCDLPASGETPVRAVRVTDECWVMGIVADTAASERVCVAVD